MNGPPPPPGIPAPQLGPLALNLRNQMLRINTNKRLAALNSIGVSPPEKNLPRLSNLATFPVTESVLAPSSKLSAKASNWAPPPLVPPPGLPPLPYMATYVATPSTIPSYTAPVLSQPTIPFTTSYVATPSTIPSYTAQPSLVPRMLIEHMLDGGRIYINDYPAYLQTELKDIMRQYRSEYSISQHYRDGNSPSKNPYYFIRKTANRPPLRSMGQTKKQRRHNKRKQTRRHR